VTQVRLDPTVTSNVVTYTVVIKADNPDLKLKPGLTATISIFTLELNDVLTVEAKAINFKPEREVLATYNQQHGLETKNSERSREATALWVLGSDGSITPKIVTLGASDGVNVEILSGISAGDQIVYSLKGVSKTEVATGEQSKSPFMPQRGGGGKR